MISNLRQLTVKVREMTDLDLKWVKEIVSTDEAPAAVGPYSQATAAGPLVFCSGQLGLIPGKKEFAGTGIEEQAKQAMENMAAVLEAAGSSLDMILKTTVFLKDMDDFKTFNEVYSEFFEDDPPARAAFQVARLPLDAVVEIEAVALRD
jgi:2-iminobutanoate/2-iminopropanoate deaminase